MPAAKETKIERRTAIPLLGDAIALLLFSIEASRILFFFSLPAPDVLGPVLLAVPASCRANLPPSDQTRQHITASGDLTISLIAIGTLTLRGGRKERKDGG